MKHAKLVTWLSLVLGLGALIVLSGEELGFGEKHTASVLSQAIMPTVGPIRDIITAKGRVAYNHQFVLRAHISGQVTELAVKEGDEVTRGRHLLRITAPQEEIDLDLRKIDLQRGQKKLSAIDEELIASRRLVAVGGMSQYELDQKTLERDLANKERQRAQLEISRLEQSRALSTLISPVKGLVLSVTVENGQRVNAGDELVSLTGGAGPYIITFVDAMDVERIHSGQSVVFSTQEDGGKQRKGIVREIGRAVADSQRPNSVKVVIEPLESIHDMPISQQLYVEIIILEEASVLRIPRELLSQEGGHQVVYVLTEQGIVTKPVQIQSGDVSFAKVISGLTLSDRLVRNPQHVRGIR